MVLVAPGDVVVQFAQVGLDETSPAGEKGRPFTSDLTGQEFWTLLRSGYRPVGFVMGNCVYYVPPALLNVPPQMSGEIPAYTHALYDARELAMERMQAENDFALDKYLRIFSVYHSADGTKFWVITEADRSVTTVLLPEEY